MTRELVLWLLLSACAYRATRLITKDTFPPVLWIRDRLAGGWRKLTELELDRYYASSEKSELIKQWEIDKNDLTQRYVRRVSWSPHWLAELITCPWCASAYVSGALVLVTDCVIGIQWPWLMGGAVWAGSSLLASREWA